MLNSSPNRLSDANLNIAGIKRRAPSLLPAFEPSSSPPRFKRQKARSFSSEEDENLYPQNIPSSSLGMLPSSPPPQLPTRRAPLLQRTQSVVSERAPLSALPSITLSEDGEPVLLGRSSKSSHYNLSSNRLISRVHIKAFYTCKNGKPKIEIQCMGWNGVKIHCQGNAWELAKGDVFTSETEHAEIMLDIQDSRVLLAWPGTAPDSVINIPGSPVGHVRRSPSFDWGNAEQNDMRSRAIASRRKLTPVSPTPRRSIMETTIILPSESSLTTDSLLDIYEDEPVPEFGEDDDAELPPPVAEASLKFSQTTTRDLDEEVSLPLHKDSGFESDMILPPVGTFSTAESLRATPAPSTPSRRSLAPLASSPPASRQSSHRRTASISPNKYNTLQNHLTNQLAFSRVATVPLSELHEHLPSKLAESITKPRLLNILTEIDCIGEVKRSGKDAAGKPLESHFYYLAEKDQDEGRRAAVGGRAGVRNCRKQHKQYYWKKPKQRS
ncbi:hypothetical protein EDC01DRAFT_312800 [Geopyxis carbonaria]|nr:hypothetical protein EDC01DRAFT_312800 [Geopyxis carbonaria]